MTIGDAQQRPPKTAATAAQRREQHEDLEQHKRETLHTLIGEQVLHALGEPGGLYQVQVRRLWDDRYRVNVFVGVDATSVKIPHSYFLVTDRDGNIVASKPKITKLY